MGMQKKIQKKKYEFYKITNVFLNVRMLPSLITKNKEKWKVKKKSLK